MESHYFTGLDKGKIADSLQKNRFSRYRASKKRRNIDFRAQSCLKSCLNPESAVPKTMDGLPERFPADPDAWKRIGLVPVNQLDQSG